MELLVIGIDALDPRILMDNIDRFPNMKKLIDEGVFSDYFGYVYGYGSRDNWISIYTGLTPEQHGIKNNIYTKTGEIPIYSDYKDKEPFWKILGENGISTALWRPVVGTPVEEINGFMVGGEYIYDFQKKPRFVETEIPQTINKDIEKIIDYNAPKTIPIKTIDSLIKTYEDMDSVLNLFVEFDNYYEDGLFYLKKELKYYYNNICDVYDELPTDIIYFYTSALDTIQHFQQYDINKRIIIESMIEIDLFIEKMIERLNPKNIMIISDHGSSSFNEILGIGHEKLERESFGMEPDAFWLENGHIVVKARNGGLLSSVHEIQATFICAGEKIKQNRIKDMRTVDIYPTLLEFFNIDIPKDREGYVMDIFKKKTIVNKEKVYKSKRLDKILIIQNIEVFNFNKVLNDIFLENRFSEITILCEEKYMDIFSKNTRINNILTYKENINLDNIKEDYDKIYITKKDITKNEWTYLRII